ncbi:MAG TPA: flavin reductase family protein [Pseudonocardia sp.]|nr:flavin reductase family protein [Pseudonocardia sp.]
MTTVGQIDQATFRAVLGHFPTSVVAVTSVDAARRPVGMAVGSFTSVSLSPPLVAFFPDLGSSTFPHIRDSAKFCVNLLGDSQHDVCGALSVKGGDKFAELGWRPAPSGAPIIEGALAWIDCSIHSVTPAGDHYLVLGEVTSLAVVGAEHSPLIFFKGAYDRLHGMRPGA